MALIGIGRAGPGLASGAAEGWFAARFAEERERWALWLPVALGAGIAAYFALRLEPEPLAGAAAAGAALVLASLLRGRPALGVALLALAAFATGFAVAGWRAHSVAAPVLVKRHGPVVIEATVRGVDAVASGRRLLIEDLVIPGLPPERVPARVRLHVGTRDEAALPGERVRLRAVLRPLPSPVAPGAYDFQRAAWFERLGAVGYAIGPVERLGEAPAGGGALALAAFRQRLFLRLVQGFEGRPAGGVAAALMVGDRSAIDEGALAALRDSGLAHLLAISGLHVGMVAGLLFFVVRGGLALAPSVALRHPIKKWAALAALAGALAYVLVSGATVPTQRAFLMILIVIAAVLLDRTAISMRLVAWAAVPILIAAPESLLGPSFQLSFAAVVALIAVYEAVKEPLVRLRAGADGGPSALRRAGVYLLAVGLSTFTAGLATAPFAAYHFNRFAVYGLAANMLAIPLTAFWIMPWALVAFLLMLFGLEALALDPLGLGIDLLLAVAGTVASWPGAVARVPQMPTSGLALVALGGLWLCLWRRPWRFLGLAGITAGMLSIGLARPPDVLISPDARLFALREADGELRFSTETRGRFGRDVWLRREGREGAPWSARDGSGEGGVRCDAVGCVLVRDGVRLAIVEDARGLAEDCRLADFVVSLDPVRGRCSTRLGVIDRFDLWRDGAQALWIEGGRVRVVSDRALRGARPWVPRRDGGSRPPDPRRRSANRR
ncbi:MAG: ComEC/Rec2 family competence protein [Proteobacteria bacterium]|nr:ComEC/Rec2 family competence protein [Pseudomonadota bacterium]